VNPVVDLRPLSITWHMYQGDPQELRVHLVHQDDGTPADVAGWSWSARIATIPPTPFECFGEDDGVTLYLRGAGTYNLGGRWWPFDVACRNPDAGEGVTVLRGQVLATARVTEPLLVHSS
jgi:hypothetical protein